ncbi:CHASE2 domain-containing protein [Halomonas sp. TBZ9]|uniref:CHASE2 domain-containing protein n=1 Tax=Vreelandella azerica TaxID=2732867 RepID=A0A7Y3XAM3_9GAMM|nr:CHASE2 domain-containing protein [Halomonas azerica]NOG31365.1 CHASE2 domain-containing protein [Halomonas azerica]
MPQDNYQSSGVHLTQALHRRFVITWWATVSLLLPFAFLIYSISPLLSDNYLYDTWLSSQSSPPSQDILIIEIDEPSLQWFGRWPWPRDIHARLVEKLDAAGASAVVLDILLIESSRDSQQDQLLVEAMKAHGNVHIPLALLPERTSGAPFRDTLMPIPALMLAAASVGHINISLDSDGVAREVVLKEARDDVIWPQLMASVAGIPAEALDTTPVRIPYRGWPKHYPSVSYHDVLEGRLPESFLKDRIVLVGMTALGMGDRYNMSLLSSELMPGVEVHAHLLDALRDDNLIYPVPPLTGAVLAGLPIIMLMLLAWWLRFRFMLGIVILLSGVAVVGSLFALGSGWWWPPSASLIALGLAFVVIVWRSQATLLSWFEQELKLLYREPPILPYRQVLAPNEGGKLYQQLQSLEFALTRLVQGRRLILDVMHSLPLPIFILNEDGSVLLANRKAVMLGENGERAKPVQHIKDLPEVVSFEEEREFAALWPPTAFDGEDSPSVLTGVVQGRRW